MTRSDRPRSPRARRAALVAAALVGVAAVAAPPASARTDGSPVAGHAALRLPATARTLVDDHGARSVLEGTGLGLWGAPATAAEARIAPVGVPDGPQVAAAEAARLEAFLAGVAHRRRAALRTFVEAAARRAEEQRAAEARAAAAAQERATRRSAGGASDLAGLRNCESGGDYGAVSSSGTYRGAYQFSRETWNSVAAGSHPHLVGVDPAAASPADQDAMARTLRARSGSSPWPHCGRHL